MPIPYPNIAMGMTALPPTACLKVLLMAGPAHNMMTTVPLSNGDNAGVNMGVASGRVMGPSRHLFGSTNVFYGGMPATKKYRLPPDSSRYLPAIDRSTHHSSKIPGQCALCCAETDRSLARHLLHHQPT